VGELEIKERDGFGILGSVNVGSVNYIDIEKRVRDTTTEIKIRLAS